MTVPFQRIVLAEDDPHDVELTIEALTAYNLVNRILPLRDGAAVLDFLYRRGRFAEEPPENPTLILLDLKLPRIDGIDVLRQVKGDPNLAKIPVVVLTGSRDSQDLETCYRLGANAYVVKPVTFVGFVEAVRKIGAFWMLVNQPPS
jgi:two-component system response regulator